jgi:glycosyltransferase involved in cell wall biosynthesis
MKIAFFCDTYQPTHNGVAVSVATTSAELRARGHRVVIFAPRYKGFEDADPDVVRFPATPFYRVRDFPVAWPILPYFSLPAWKRFLDEKFDVVHSHSPFILGTVGARWAKYSRLPLVFTFHTLYHRYIHHTPFPPVVARPYTLEKLKNYCALCDHIIAPSCSIERVVLRFRPDAQTSVIPTGVELSRFQNGDRNAGREQFAASPQEKLLLYVGRVSAEKNLNFLIRSLAPLLRNDAKTPARLLIVGDGPATKSLKSLVAQLQISQRVVFTGFLDNQSLLDCYAAADVFVFASRTETQGVCIAEALAAGLPCVVVGAMGAGEAIENEAEGFVVPPHDARFCDATQRLILDDDLRARMSEAARQKANSLSLQNSAGKLLDLYQHLSLRA